MGQAFEEATLVQLATVKVSNGEGHGSGIVLNPDGIIATCSHVVSSLRTGTISSFLHDKEIKYQVIARGYEEENDVALLKADFSEVDKSNLGLIKPLGIRTGGVYTGESVMVCGYPSVVDESRPGETDTSLPPVTSGVVSKISLIEDSRIMISATLYPGNSGGPCFDGENRLLGLASAAHVFGSVEVVSPQGRFLRLIPTNYGLVVPVSFVTMLAKECEVTLTLA
jgi:S1-C subfamily serine protease